MNPSNKKQFDKGFTCGVVYAIARLIEMHDYPTIAIEILEESGCDYREADKYDIKFLKPELKLKGLLK